MNNQHKIDQIVRDLYALDPSFQKHEASLREMIAAFVNNKPEIAVDAAFAESLRRKLDAKASLKEAIHPRRFDLVNGAFAIITLAAVIVAGTTYWKGSGETNKTAKDTISLLDTTERISPQEPHAFGALAITNTATPESGGKGGAGSSTMTQDYAMGDGKMIAPDMYQPVNFVFTYTGEALADLPQTVSVFKRQTAPTNNQGLLDRINLGAFDIGKLRARQLDSLAISEDREWGYVVYANLKEGTVDINQNWEKWPLPEKECRDDACYQALRITIDQIPNDSQAIDIANSFLRDYAIKTSGYGQPQVMNQWRREYLAASDRSQAFVPDTVTVVYPLIIDGKEVKDESGYPQGINIGIHVKTGRVTYVGGLTSRSFDQADYTAETNTSRILELAKKGTWRNNSYTTPNAKSVGIELGTPTRGYMLTALPDLNNQYRQLYVPALFFPVTKNSTENPYYSSAIAIPIVKEVLDAAAAEPAYPIDIMERAQ